MNPIAATRAKLAETTETDVKILHDTVEGWYFLEIETEDDEFLEDFCLLFAHCPWGLRMGTIIYYWEKFSFRQMLLILLCAVVTSDDTGPGPNGKEPIRMAA